MDELRVIHDGGDRFTIRIANHEVVVDQPVPAGGTDEGPTPTDLFVASLASCTAFYAGRFLARHGIDPAGLEVGYTFAMGDRPARVASVEMDLRTPPLPEGLEPRLRSVVEHCTVKNSLEHPPALGLRISQAAAAGR